MQIVMKKYALLLILSVTAFMVSAQLLNSKLQPTDQRSLLKKPPMNTVLFFIEAMGLMSLFLPIQVPSL